MPDPTAEEWEQYLLADPGAEEWALDWKRAEGKRQAARELERSIKYARENGYDINPVTGQYLPPEGER